MVVVALLSVDLVESVDLVSVYLVVNCICRIIYAPDGLAVKLKLVKMIRNNLVKIVKDNLVKVKNTKYS